MQIVPKPKQYSENGRISILPEITADETLLFCVKAFSRIVKKLYGIYLNQGDNGIKLCCKADLPADAYEIDGATIFASSPEGARYGLASLLQLMEVNEDKSITLVNAKIAEKPDKDFRGFMSDLARQWHPVEVIIEYIDLCYINKIKYLQLHFTDNPSWTLPFDAFPKAATPGRSYTKQEIAFIVEYAHEAGVELVPEFEGIGHSEALIDTYPELFGNVFEDEMDNRAAVSAHADALRAAKDRLMCIGRPDIFQNIRAFLKEICEMFVYSKYIHVGCDEARHENWAKCTLCKAYMEKHNIPTTLALYSHFVKKVTDICLELGKTPIVWEGFPREGADDISRDVIVMEFESYYQLAPDLLEQGFRVINTSWKPMYILPPSRKDRQWTVIEKDWNVHNWQHFADFSPAFENPINVAPTDMVLGGMLCQWECTPEQEKGSFLTNLPMAADRLWNEKSYYSAEEFESACKKLRSLQSKLTQ